MASQEKPSHFRAVQGETVRKGLQIKTLAAIAVLAMGIPFVGCKSAPELSNTQALALIQAKYDQTAPGSTTIVVDDLGMRQGATGKLWDRTKIYPNKFWADFKLTPDGQKTVKLTGGGDVIEWRPASAEDTNYSITMTVTPTGHLKAHNLENLQDEMIDGVATAKGADFSEVVDLSGLPEAIQQIGRNPLNRLSARRHADFALENGKWELHAIK
jgi:hypothetical protein